MYWICCNCGNLTDDGIPTLDLCMTCADDDEVFKRVKSEHKPIFSDADNPNDYDCKYDGDYSPEFEG